MNYFNASTLRSGELWARKQMNLMLLSIASLRVVGYTSTVHVILGGSEIKNHKYLFDSHVKLYWASTSSFPVPRWANFFYRSSFEKIWYLHLSAIVACPLLCLDNDVVAFQSLTMLYRQPVPAFVVKPQEGINSGVMFIHETVDTVRKRLDRYKNIMGGGDGGDQHLLNVFHSEQLFFELPSAYNVYTHDMNTSIPLWWKQVVLWHKVLEKGKLAEKPKEYVLHHLMRIRKYSQVHFNVSLTPTYSLSNVLSS
jgi:hypothetical protein